MKERILITVKTYPTISRTYSELVCTAGLREDGSWVRIYPVPFRKMFNQYAKFQWIEANLIKNVSDPRVESYRLMSPDDLVLLDTVGTESDWRERRELILDGRAVHRDLAHIIERNKARDLSLVTFQPSKILDMKVEAVDREWDQDKIAKLRAQAPQQDFFDDTTEYFEVVEKLPYKFSYKWQDAKGKITTMMVEDWEIGALYWNMFRDHGSEEIAIQKVKEKYLDWIAGTRDVYLFLGTTQQYDARAPNPFLIIGVFYPPYKLQEELF